MKSWRSSVPHRHFTPSRLARRRTSLPLRVVSAKPAAPRDGPGASGEEPVTPPLVGLLLNPVPESKDPSRDPAADLRECPPPEPTSPSDAPPAACAGRGGQSGRRRTATRRGGSAPGVDGPRTSDFGSTPAACSASVPPIPRPPRRPEHTPPPRPLRRPARRPARCRQSGGSSNTGYSTRSPREAAQRPTTRRPPRHHYACSRCSHHWRAAADCRPPTR